MGFIKKSKYLSLLLFVLLVIGGCGGAGQPGSSGSEDTGIKISATLQVSDAGAPTAGMVDVYQNPDCDGDVSTNDPEDFYDALGNVSITTTSLSKSGEGSTLYITEYTVRYLPQPPSNPPELSQITFKRSITLLPDSTTEETIILVPVDTKDEFASTECIGSSCDQGNYSIEVTFSGESDVGEQFSFVVYADALFDSYDNCQ